MTKGMSAKIALIRVFTAVQMVHSPLNPRIPCLVMEVQPLIASEIEVIG